jgi:hypothetical protein
MTISIYIYEYDLQNILEPDFKDSIIVYSTSKLINTQVKININIQHYLDLLKNNRLRKIEMI